MKNAKNETKSSISANELTLNLEVIVLPSMEKIAHVKQML
jgi:hypothetical protein